MHDLTEHLHDLFAPFGEVQIRRMFGGHGVFHEGIMFGLIVDDVLYLKADPVNLPDFEALGLGQFTFVRQGRVVGLPYYLAPEEALDDPWEAARWARRSFDAALRIRVEREARSSGTKKGAGSARGKKETGASRRGKARPITLESKGTRAPRGKKATRGADGKKETPPPRHDPSTPARRG